MAFKNRMSLVHNHTAILEEEGSSRDILQTVGDFHQEEQRELSSELEHDSAPFSNSVHDSSPALHEDVSAAKETESVSSLSQPYKGRLTNLFTFEKTRVESFDGYNDYSLQNPHIDHKNTATPGQENVFRRESNAENTDSCATLMKPSLLAAPSQRFSKSRQLGGGGVGGDLSHMESGTSQKEGEGDGMEGGVSYLFLLPGEALSPQEQEQESLAAS